MAMLRKYKLYLIIAGVMLAEALVLMFILPKSSPELTTLAVASNVRPDPQVSELLKVNIGNKFTVSNLSDSNLPVRLEVKVCAEIDAKNKIPFEAVLKSRAFRIQEAITTVLRKASTEDLHDPDLAAVKRQIKDAVTEVIGREHPMIEGLIIPEFKSTEL